MFGSKKSAGKKSRARVNLERRFTVLSDHSSQGSMSRVQKALDTTTGRTVCLKVQIPDKNAAAAARSAMELRPSEGEIAMKVEHPYVVRTFEHGESTRGEHFLVMEFIDGVSLQCVRDQRTATLAEKVEMLAQAAEGLAAVHAAGFIHRDIAPKNYLVKRDGTVKLIDFGLTVPNTPPFRKPGNRTGTVQYMAPELIRREATDERIDIFAFGTLAFELLTDQMPYDAGGAAAANSMSLMLQRINQDPIDPAQANPKLPTALSDLLRKLTARRKEDRWPTMATVADALRSVPLSRKGPARSR